jgi:hypothetical protein
MKKTFVLGIVIGLLVVLPLAHLAVSTLIPPLPTHQLAKSGHFVSIHGIDTYYEQYGSGPPLILVPAGGSHTSTWRFNVDALSRSHESGLSTFLALGTPTNPQRSLTRTTATPNSFATSWRRWELRRR